MIDNENLTLPQADTWMSTNMSIHKIYQSEKNIYVGDFVHLCPCDVHPILYGVQVDEMDIPGQNAVYEHLDIGGHFWYYMI